MTNSDDGVRSCPACGTSISGNKSTCPSCGKKLTKSAKLECPSCGELVRKGSKECPVCKTDLSGISTKAKPHSAKKSKPVKKTTDQETTALNEIESTQIRDEDKKFSCPKCAGPLAGTESKCPACGHILKGKTPLRCRACGASLKKGLRECPKCAVAPEDSSVVAEPETPVDSSPPDKSSEEVIVEKPVNTRPCPYCGAIIPESLQRCPLCNTDFVVSEPQEEAAVLDSELPTVQPSEDFAIAPLKVDAPEEAPVLDAESPKVQPSEDSTIAPVMADVKAVSPVRKRKLKSANVVTVPVMSQTNVHGRTNGLGHINGLGKAKGTDMASGDAFVNGTGISNGLGTRSKEGSAKRRSLLTRWQVLAVLVAIIIVISTFVFLSYSNESDKFSVDGNFSDWNGATTYGTKIQSTASTSNITEWAIGTESSKLFVYIKTQANIMSSSNAESYYLFVDSDGLNSTGYIMESIGADYMLQLMGWDSAVKSTSLTQYSSSSDQYDWNAWSSIGSLSCSLDLTRLEAGATLPVVLEQSAKFLLVTKDSADRGSVSYTAPLKGGVLVVEQVPSTEVAVDGILPKSTSVTMLTLRFTCEGEGGRVDTVNPIIIGASTTNQESAFSIDKGEEHEVVIAVDTSTALDGQFVSAEVLASSVVSSFDSIEIVGSGASAYVGSRPSVIAIDGAFADWAGRLSADHDSIPVTNSGTDINEVGNVSTAQDSYFYVSVEGDMCNGTFVPAMVAKPSGSGGGGGVVRTRLAAEDTLRIYVDSDKSNSTGKVVALNSKQIGADQLIEVKGLFGRITSMKEFDYSASGTWVEMTDVVDAAKDTKRLEISVSAASIGGSADIDFIFETTSWKGRSDLATFDPSSMIALTRTWVVDPATTSPYATSMSYQRKMFYDGTNYWSFFFDGTNTVHKYSVDDGQTWTDRGSVFTTPGVNETSIWYDSATSTVYAVGDISTATNNVSIQVGTIDAPAHKISWAASDSSLNTSRNVLAGKNTYICKDTNGYLWMLSSNRTLATAYQLSAFKSFKINGTASWVFSGQMLAVAAAADNVKGSIVPAGSGSEVWAIYAYAGNVAGRKYTGTWSAPAVIYAPKGGDSRLNTDNSPPSVVVDGKGVVHVVYGNGYKWGPASIPRILYSHNNTGRTTFTTGLDLDPLEALSVGDYYPTISLDALTTDLHVFWLQSVSTTTFEPITVMGSKNVSGTWSYITIEPQTSFAKQYLTSIYSVSGEFKVSWQWTQNATTPIDVILDHQEIPEFGDLTLPVIGVISIFAVYIQRPRRKQHRHDRQTGH